MVGAYAAVPNCGWRRAHLCIMKKYGRFLFLAVAITALTFCASSPQSHPAYLSALENLRAARWMIEHRPGDWVRTAYEVDAVQQINWAIFEIKKSAISDDMNIDWHPAVDEETDRAGRLHSALQYLDKAQSDISQEEGNFFAAGSRDRAIGGIEAAILATNRALID